MKPRARLPVVLGVGEPVPAWSDEELLEVDASDSLLPWSRWMLSEGQTGLDRPVAARADLELRVRSIQRGSGLERAFLQAFRALAPTVAAWFPQAGPPPCLRELLQLGVLAEQADVLLVPGTDPTRCRLWLLAAPQPELFRMLAWEAAPPIQELQRRALAASISVYCLPSPA